MSVYTCSFCPLWNSCCSSLAHGDTTGPLSHLRVTCCHPNSSRSRCGEGEAEPFGSSQRVSNFHCQPHPSPSRVQWSFSSWPWNGQSQKGLKTISMEFTVFTNNNPTVHLQTDQLGWGNSNEWPNWQASNIIKHWPGMQNRNADALPRPEQRREAMPVHTDQINSVICSKCHSLRYVTIHHITSNNY